MSIFLRITKGWKKFQVAFYRRFGRDYLCECGHTTKWKAALTIDGHEGVFSALSKKPQWCPECYAKAAIKCAWCQGTILPGEPITLYSSLPPNDFFVSSGGIGKAREQREKGNFVIPDHAVVYRQEPYVQLVGCLRRGCCDTGGDRAGFWVMPGKVKRVMTAIEQMIAQGGEEAIIINDFGSLDQAIPVVDAD